jgi:LDH2 family malate/lactate/ureidoglycolate dehydrogenase
MKQFEMAEGARYRAQDLLAWAGALLRAAGLPDERAEVVAKVLLEGDLLGHTTHGLDLLPRYLQELDDGQMARAGDPETLNDCAAALTWDGRHLPGPWLVEEAIAAARQRLSEHPLVTVVIRRSHHIGCLQAYLKPVTDDGLIIFLTCSDPSAGGVTPYGGLDSRLTPNPIAAGFPTRAGPVLIDISMSTTSNAMARRLFEEGRRFPGPWLVDADGRPSDDPATLFGERPGAVMPLGGFDLGYKGFAMALLVEALTSGLAGHGRADQPQEWGSSVFLQLMDPERFAGRAAFERQTTWLAELCRATRVGAGRPRVRLPGEAALARRTQQLQDGVALYPTVLPALAPWTERLGVPLPTPI